MKKILFFILSVAISFTATSQNKDIVFADTTKGIFILVNKSFQLSKNYIPADLVKMTEKYGDSTKMIKKETYVAYKKMHDNAKKEGISLWITSAYRTYNYQKWLYERSVKANGSVYADKTVAKHGFSEHQTGLAIDIVSERGKSLKVEF
jgi:D-alanyl-D-alanine carboxypeptidase